MTFDILSDYQIERRNHWIWEISQLSGNFGADTARGAEAVNAELEQDGLESLLGHLRLCGAIPESYGRDSSEEKLYSKYTDLIIAKAFSHLGLCSRVLDERADAADVECVSETYSFVADAKAFRLSRTAKNQKDFKVSAMDRWRYGRPYATVVCPIYQLPANSSQIYLDATNRNICILSFTHLALLVRYSEEIEPQRTIDVLEQVLKIPETITPSKQAVPYWQAINNFIISIDSDLRDLWREEKLASQESIAHARDEALTFLASERDRIMRMSREQAIDEVINKNNITKRENAISRVSDNGLLNVD